MTFDSKEFLKVLRIDVCKKVSFTVSASPERCIQTLTDNTDFYGLRGTFCFSKDTKPFLCSIKGDKFVLVKRNLIPSLELHFYGKLEQYDGMTKIEGYFNYRPIAKFVFYSWNLYGLGFPYFVLERIFRFFRFGQIPEPLLFCAFVAGIFIWYRIIIKTLKEAQKDTTEITEFMKKNFVSASGVRH